MTAGCGESDTTGETPGDTATEPRSENTETPTPTETETPAPTEEPYPGHQYTGEIESRLSLVVFEVLDVNYKEGEQRYDVRYQSATTSQSGLLNEIAEVIGTFVYFVDHGKASRDWDCQIYMNVEGDMTFFGEYTISKRDAQEYIAGMIDERTLFDRTMRTLETADE